jgi:hypothetical protein
MGLRTIAVVALAAWVGWLLVRGLIRRKVPWIGIAIVLVPLVLLFWTERQWVTAEKKFTAVALSIEPIAAGLHCQRLGETFVSSGSDLGHVDFEDGTPSGPAVISYDTCNRLAAYWRSTAREKDTPTLEEVIAVHVLTHESIHLTGSLSESITECRAVQRDAVVAQRLGATEAQGRALALRYWTEVYPHLTDAYQTRDCHEDGPMDRTPKDGVWP